VGVAVGGASVASGVKVGGDTAVTVGVASSLLSSAVAVGVTSSVVGSGCAVSVGSTSSAPWVAKGVGVNAVPHPLQPVRARKRRKKRISLLIKFGAE
jgi:hypothetical protein